MIKHVLFDFDGTLVDSKKIFVTVFNQLAAKYCFKRLEQEDIEHVRKLPFRERCRFFQLPLYRLPFLTTESYSLYRFFLKDLLLVEGIREVLDELKRRDYRLTIMSSNSEHNIRAFLEKNEVTAVDSIFCSSNILGKDRMIRKFLKKENRTPRKQSMSGMNGGTLWSAKKAA